MRAPLAMRTLIAVACVAAGCVGGEHDGAAERKSELVIRTLMAAMENADTAVVLDLFWPQATYDDYQNQTSHQGLEEILAYVTSVHEWGDDVYLNVGRVHASETTAVAEWVFSAFQNRPLGALVPEPTGREVVLNGVTIIELEGGRIVRAADYTDAAALMLQLGGRIELPGGQVVELDDVGN